MSDSTPEGRFAVRKPPESVTTIVDLLRWRAVEMPDACAYTFLEDGEARESSLTYGELDRRARAVGAALQNLGSSGRRALLLYPPGLDYIVGFFGCLNAGVVPVPAYPPHPRLLARTLPRLLRIVEDAQASLVLTIAAIRAASEMIFNLAPTLRDLQWLASDELAAGPEEPWRQPALSSDSLAFLQYTSGSTADPRGVMLSHGNVLSNLSIFLHAIESASKPDEEGIGISWLPPYHDMGLIACILGPLYVAGPCVLMSPIAFLQKPIRWLKAIARHKQPVDTGGPGFAYELCVNKVKPEERAELDLSSWQVAGCGAEPIRPEVLERFAATFAPCGFRPEAFYVGYGLAEATLIVSADLTKGPPVIKTFDRAALEAGRVVEARARDGGHRLTSCGPPMLDQHVVIVDPESRRLSPPDRIGEIWISGPNVAQGYWNRPEETERTFHARLADTGEGPFLRTGDLGFLSDGHLFVTGRLKDLIIIRGRNLYPQDIELTVETSHPALRAGCGAAIAVDQQGQEQLVVIQEVEAGDQDLDAVIRAVRDAVTRTHGVNVHAVRLLPVGAIAKTSSGKIQRHACRRAYLEGSLETVTEWTFPERA